MNLIIFFCLVFLVISLIVQKLKIGGGISSLMSFALLFVTCGFITTSADWAMYEFFYERHDKQYFEPMFYIIGNFFDFKNFPTFHMLYIAIYSIALIWLIKIFHINPYLVILIYFPIVYLFYTTQIRFFMGYYPAMLALYYFSVKRNYIIAAILFLFAILSHNSFFLILLFIPFSKISIHKLFKFSLLFSFFLGILMLFSVTILKIDLLVDSKVGDYVKESVISSFLGGLFYFIPYFLFIFYIDKLFKNKMKINSDVDAEMIFLYHMSIFPIIFFIIALPLQVFGHRFIVTGFVFILLLFFRLRLTTREKIIFSLMIVYLYMHIYILPNFIFKESNFDMIRETFLSNSIYSKYFF